MKTGKICVKHPELNGLRTNSHVCAGCKRASDLERKKINRHHMNAKQRGRIALLKQIILNHYGRVCAICGFDHVDALTIDHIDQKGGQHRREIKASGRGGGGMVMYKWLIKNEFPEGFRTLCFNCNIIEYRKYQRSTLI
jgi:hypothetical protein